MSKKSNTKDRIKDIGIIVGGGALGAGAGYGASRLLHSRFGDTLRRVDPNQRLKYIVPALGAIATAGSLARMQQKAHEKKAEYYLEYMI